MPIRHDLYADRVNWADDADPFIAAGGFNQRGEWMVLFTDSRPIWVAAWIDSRDDLQRAYHAILKLPDPLKRQSMIDRLADLPIEMADVEKLRNERKRIKAATGDLDEWRARQQIQWAERFREHYRAVARQAGGK